MNIELELALLALDSYNQGAAAAIDPGNQIGDATVIKLPNNPDYNAAAFAAGFSATAYQLADGRIIIAYRGTDSPTGSPEQGGSDLMNGWILGAGYSGASQVS